MWEAFEALPLEQQVFATMAIGFGALLLGLLLVALIGADADLDADGDIDVDSSGLFSVKGILAFLAFFGGGGWLALRADWPLWIALIVGALFGYAVMSSLLYLLARLRGLDTSGTRRSEDLLGEEGTVYLFVPPAGQGIGRVQVRQGRRLVEVEAESAGPAIATGAPIRVVALLGEHRVQVEATDALPGGFGSPKI